MIFYQYNPDFQAVNEPKSGPFFIIFGDYLIMRKKPGLSSKQKSVAGAAVIAWILLHSCSLPSLSDITVPCAVIMPSRHPSLAGTEAINGGTWTVRWMESDGSERRITGVRECVVIELPANGVTPVLLIEESDHPGFAEPDVLPAGALFPTDAIGGNIRAELRPDRISGICARCAELVTMYATGGRENGKSIVDAFNWPRLERLLVTLENPGRADLESIALKILSGYFSSSYVREHPAVNVRLPAGSFSTLNTSAFPANPLEKEAPIETDGSAVIFIRDGINRFFVREGTLDITAESGRIVCTFFHPCD